MKILVATDAWHPQVNGVVRTLTHLAEEAPALGVTIEFLTPDLFWSLPLRGEAGPLEAPSAYYMKSPPRQFRDSVALEACDAFIEGRRFERPGDEAGARIVSSPQRS